MTEATDCQLTTIYIVLSEGSRAEHTVRVIAPSTATLSDRRSPRVFRRNLRQNKRAPGGTQEMADANSAPSQIMLGGAVLSP